MICTGSCKHLGFPRLSRKAQFCNFHYVVYSREPGLGLRESVTCPQPACDLSRTHYEPATDLLRFTFVSHVHDHTTLSIADVEKSDITVGLLVTFPFIGQSRRLSVNVQLQCWIISPLWFCCFRCAYMMVYLSHCMSPLTYTGVKRVRLKLSSPPRPREWKKLHIRFNCAMAKYLRASLMFSNCECD